MQRVRNELRDPNLRENRNTRKPPSHAATESEDDEGNQVALEEDARPELGEYKEPETESGVLVGTVRVLTEDCGGNLALPHYGFSRPSSDYYNSNLMLHSFIQCDIASGINHIAYFDERTLLSFLAQNAKTDT